MASFNCNSVKTTNVVVSGISGVFPKSNNIEEFKQNLLSANDMISEYNRWDSLSKENVTIGIIETLDRFDHSFFGVSRRQAEIMNISERILMEKVFEAILDAGYNPKHFKGTNTGVFLAICHSERDYDALNEINEYTMMQMLRTSTANRISYFLDVHGPSTVIDSACSSSLYALDYAHNFIQKGECEAAIVCGINLCVSQFAHQAALKCGALSPNGRSRTFDANADGYVRAEAIVATVLQKEKDARRIYANLIHSKTNCDGYTEEGVTFPSKSSQINLLRQFYSEINIDPRNVSYVEAHGTGTKVGDKVEGNAISEFFCPKNRTIKLKIGSVKSNMGHSEACAGLCSLVKIIIAFETGFIPPNLNFEVPNPGIPGLTDGTMEVVTSPTKCEGEYFGLNSYGIGGSNAHALISPNKKSKLIRTSNLNKNIPNLITVSGRTEEAVDIMLQDIVKNREDVEYFGLWREIFSDDIIGYAYRGYVIIDEENEPEKNIKFSPEERRPIWFVFAGMGSQWPTMGKSLLKIPIFAQSIQKSHKIIETKGINLMKIITDDDPDIFKSILNSFLGIAAIQIALVDTLKELGIEPDGMIGHSAGEMGCAYADECLTAEQTLLVAYYRGLVSLETEFVHGTMATVGESYDRIKDMMFPQIDIAAHNSSTNYTISGPTDTVKKFITELQEKSIFVREVNTSNIPYHSRYIASAGPKLISYLKELIPKPKLRSNKWISTSVPESEWNTNNAQYSSAEYFTNNLLNPVYFEQGSRHIPDNAITIEIAPHGLLQAILKRSLPSTVDNIPLTRKGDKNGVTILLRALGQIHLAGRTPKLNNLYPPVIFPVSRGTPMISPLIRWQHDDLWPLPKSVKKYTTSCERSVTIDLDDHKNNYLRGHVVDGRNLFPATGYLCMIWETIASMKGKRYQDLSVVFENIRFEKATNIQDKQSLINFFISIQTGTGHFEISENNAIIATGLVRIPEDVTLERFDVKTLEDVSNFDTMLLKTKDFYKALRLRGYHYSGLFKKIQCCNHKGTYAKASWCDNFVPFIDNMLQMMILNKDINELIIPTFINKIVIDVQKHQETLTSLEHENPEFTIKYYSQIDALCSGGIQITGLKSAAISRKKENAEPVLEKYQFLPHISDEKTDLNSAIRLCVHIALENVPQIKVKTVELLNEDYDSNSALISILVADALSDLPTIQGEIKIVKNSDSQEISISKTWPAVVISEDKLPSNNSCLLAVVTDLSRKSKVLHEVLGALQNKGFIIAIESNLSNDVSFENLGLNICFNRTLDNDKRILLLRKAEQEQTNTFSIQIQNSSYSWIKKVQNTLDKLNTVDNEKLIIYAEKEPNSGIMGFFNCIRKEQKGTNMRCFFIMDDNAPKFSLEHKIYKTQFEKDLSHNVYKNGQWGSYRHLQMEPLQDIEVDHTFCTQLVKGDLSTFRWVQGSIDPYNHHSSEKHIIHVYYSGLNFKDVMIGVGRISITDTYNCNRFEEFELGLEYCGKDASGQRFTGITLVKALSNLVETIPHLTWRVPDYMSLEDASTIPVVYATVIYAFFIKMNLKNRCSVLIHAGSGGIGQAAINICLHYGCEIFTTVGTPQKVEYIRKKFPQIPESHIGNSRDTSFFTMIMKETNGKGVNVVLNSLAEEKLRTSIRCVAAGGDFLEIGKSDMLKNNILELGPFINAINFHSIHLDCLEAMSPEIKHSLQTKVQHMLDMGIIKPIDRTVFAMTQVEEAIRYMAAGKHLGKVIIKIRDEETNINVKPLPIRFKAHGRFLCKKDKSYLIIGGLGGFGLELADWLICRGARKIVLSSRTGLRHGYQSYKINNWRSHGVEVVISTEDVTCETGVYNLLQQANSLAPVTAIFNLAVILRDGPFNQQNEETFSISAGPKAIATIHLDKLSRQMCPQLKHFVVFSSVSCGRGNAEQTNYGMSNSVMERICEKRRCDGLPALAVQWGAIGEVGIVADFAEDNINIVIGGTLQQKLKSCLETLNTFMQQSDPVVSSIIVAEKRHSGTNIINVIANIIGIKDMNTVNPNRKLPELGMDSIMATELQQVIESEIGISLTQQEMRKMTFAELCSLMENREKSQISGENSNANQIKLALSDEFIQLPLVRIPYVQNESKKEISIDTDKVVFFFPGIEGAGPLIESLAENLLPLQILCFQYYSDDIPKADVKAISEYFSKLITGIVRVDEEFRIIAYSLGTAMALEVANILEKQGRKGNLWLIDGSPSYINKSMNITGCYDTNEEYIQFMIPFKLMKRLLPQSCEEDLSKNLQEAKSWEDKINYCCSLCSPNLTKDSTTRKILDTIIRLYHEFLGYELHVQLFETQCVLIKCAENLYNLDETYGLSQYCKQPIQVHEIKDVDHYTILGEKQIPEIIKKNITLK